MIVGIRKTPGALLVLLGLLGASAASAQSPNPLELWVTNQVAEIGSPPDSVLVYAVGQANGLPVLLLSKVLAGPTTQLHVPSGILVTADKVFVSNEPLTSDPACKKLPAAAALVENPGLLLTCGSITIYDRSAIEAACSAGNALTTFGSTNVAPSKVIEGDQTGLFYPFGIAVNTAADELYVANQTRNADSGSINIYKLSAALASNGSPNVKPVRVIRDRLNGPSDIVFDAVHNQLFVANTYSGSVTVYQRSVGGDFTLVREIRDKGAGTNPLLFVSGLAGVDETVPGEPDEKLFVAHGLPPFNGLISVYGRAADPNDPTPTPLRQIVGTQMSDDDLKSLDGPTGLAFDPSHKWLFVGNNARTTSPGFISVYKSTDRNDATPLSKYRDGSGGPLFSPVGLALATAASPVATGSDYTLTNSGNVTVFPNSFVDVTIRLVLTGSGTVTFTDVLGLPQGVTKSAFSRPSCTESCDTTVRLSASPSTVLRTYPLTVTTSGVLTSPSSAPRCVARSTSFDLRVRDPIPGALNVLKRGTTVPDPGVCTVTSDKLDIDDMQPINCGDKCSGTFRPDQSPVNLTAKADTLTSIFSGWSYPGCSSLTQPCAVQIIEGATQNVTAFCDRLVHLTVRIGGSGTGTVGRDRQPLTGVACGSDCYIVNTTVTLTASPTSDSRFVRWTNCEPTDAPTCRVTLRDSTTVTATFAREVKLRVLKSELGGQGTVTSVEPGNDGQISCGSACEKKFDVGTSVTLQQTTVGSSIFAGWAPLRPAPPECAGFDSDVPASLDRQGRSSCTVVVNDNPTTVIASFVGTPQQALIARLYINVLQTAPPSQQNLDSLVSSLVDAPLLSVRALIDAFFDGPNRPPLSPSDYVKVMFRALLWRERRADEPCTNPPGDSVAERTLRTCVIEGDGGDEFQKLIGSVFPTSTR